MDIISNPKVNWLGLKFYFLGVSVLLALIGTGSLLVSGLNLGVDFTGGTLVYVRFAESPNLERIRTSLGRAGLRAESVTRFDEPSANQVQIRMARLDDESADLSLESRQVVETLRAEFDPSGGDKPDLNNMSEAQLAGWLWERDPEGNRSGQNPDDYESATKQWADQISGYRTSQSGLIGNLSELDGLGLPQLVLQTVKSELHPGTFTVISVESVGPKVGRELRDRAQNAILFSLLGMLIYIAFRFRPIYGVAAIVALFHDVFLTLGLFSLTGQEISLTVIAGLLTLVGYSINDTIVIFDRVRENLKLMRRNDIGAIINASVNQTLNRTIMTSGTTFLSVFVLYLLGGEALRGFSFALVVGIIVGTYSSVAIASPIVVWWQSWRDAKQAKA
jgi:preprotein translocase subunit SecF